MPDPSYYDPDGMCAKEKVEFERWYTKKVAASYCFVMQREMEAYCELDVKLLKAGCQKFREEFKQKTDFDPWRNESLSLPPAIARTRNWCPNARSPWNHLADGTGPDPTSPSKP